MPFSEEETLMPDKKPKAQTVATEKYQKKAGYKVKSFKLKGDIADRFAAACKNAGVSQAAAISELMQRFINENEGNDQ